MIGQSKRLSEPLGLTRGQRRVLVGLAVATALAVVGVGVWAIARGGGSGDRCVGFTFASYTGAAVARTCGADAARFCASAAGLGALGAGAATKTRGECRAKGYPVYSAAR